MTKEKWSLRRTSTGVKLSGQYDGGAAKQDLLDHLERELTEFTGGEFVLDLWDLRNGNSGAVSGISCFVVSVRESNISSIVVRVSSRHSWQLSLYKNLHKIWENLKYEFSEDSEATSG